MVDRASKRDQLAMACCGGRCRERAVVLAVVKKLEVEVFLFKAELNRKEGQVTWK